MDKIVVKPGLKINKAEKDATRLPFAELLPIPILPAAIFSIRNVSA